MVVFKPRALKTAMGTRLMIRPESWLEKRAIKRRGYKQMHGWIGRQFYCHEKHWVDMIAEGKRK